jgi:hypothetical protein
VQGSKDYVLPGTVMVSTIMGKAAGRAGKKVYIMDKYVEVYAASDITFAYLMKANLENAGIPVQITNEQLQGSFCLDGMVPLVLVPANRAEQAKQIIDEIQRSSENDQGDDEQEQ